MIPLWDVSSLQGCGKDLRKASWVETLRELQRDQSAVQGSSNDLLLLSGKCSALSQCYSIRRTPSKLISSSYKYKWKAKGDLQAALKKEKLPFWCSSVELGQPSASGMDRGPSLMP